MFLCFRNVTFYTVIHSKIFVNLLNNRTVVIMSSVLNRSYGGEKKLCPFKEKCYRKNPIHFTEMSHPHLENLLKDKLDQPVTVPDNLNFECSDKSQLAEQLKVLQTVMRKERDKNSGPKPSSSNSSSPSGSKRPSSGRSLSSGSKRPLSKSPLPSGSRPSSSNNPSPSGSRSSSNNGTLPSGSRPTLNNLNLPIAAGTMADQLYSYLSFDNFDKETPETKLAKERGNELEELKIKIEKSRQAALERRENKLKEMDAKAARMYTVDTESCRKRSPNTSNSKIPNKKAKSNTEVGDSTDNLSFSSSDSPNSGSFTSASTLSSSTSSSFQSSDSERSPGKSFIENFVESNNLSARERVRDEAIAKMKQAGHKVSLVTPGEFALKFALSAPYHYFFNRVEESKETHKQEFTVSFPELLDVSLGEIVDSLHINFMVEIGWLCLQYLLAAQNPKMTIFCGSVCDPQSSLPSNITLVEVKMPTAYGCHHSKISVFKYKDDGIRIVVSTANIYSDDWENRTQGLWMSPHLPPLPDSANPSDGESATNFKKSFREYLTAYKHPKLIEWEHLIKRADFSAVNVFFVASVPGSHKGLSINSWGHRKLATILNEHAVLPPDAPQWTLVAQCSSIGSLGPSFDSWISSNIVSSMSREKAKGLKSNPNFQFVYPSLANYVDSFDCVSGSCCLPYSRKSHEKQEWLTNYLYQWKADGTGRTKAMPHIKSYTRISPDYTQIPWFVLTSANLSKGAWGSTAKTGVSHFIMNYEAGVVFIPKFIIDKTSFPIKNSSSPDIPVFRIPYDLPLTRYKSKDKPFVVDFLNE